MKLTSIKDVDIEVEQINTHDSATGLEAELWFVKGTNVLHREDGPARITKNSTDHLRLGRYFRLDGPAREFSSGKKEWYINSLLHREDGPAVEQGAAKEYYLCGYGYERNEWLAKLSEWNKLGRIKISSYVGSDGVEVNVWKDLYSTQHRRADNDKLHRTEDDEPALLSNMFFNGPTKVWYKDGQRHRDYDRPAFTSPIGQEWYKNGRLHREGGRLASEMRLFTGEFERKKVVEGKLHSEDGPAYVRFKIDAPEGDIKYETLEEQYWIDGKQIADPNAPEEEGMSWGLMGGALAVAGLASMLGSKKTSKAKQKVEAPQEIEL